MRVKNVSNRSRYWLAIVLILCAASIASAQTFSSGSDGSDGAYDLTGTPPGTVVKFDPTQFHGTGVQNNVFNFTTITIPTGVTVKLAGDRLTGPVYWLAQGNVTIAGIVDLNGQDGAPPTVTLESRRRAIPGAGGFAGGVGGKHDAYPIPAGEPGAQPGDGPGGGSVLPFANSGVSCGNNSGTGGKNTANPFLVPLIGGSGGAGANNPTPPGALFNNQYGGGGGAGGGAIFITSSTAITMNGTMSANGGHAGASDCNASSGGGAGGSIRLTAPTINGGGTVTANGGGGIGPFAIGGPGFIRLEAFTQNFTGSFSGTQIFGSPLSTFIPATGPPSVKIVSVNGVSVTQPPTGNLATPDVAINSTSPVSVTVQATNIPPGTVLTLRVYSANNMDQTVQTTPLLGTLQSSTATATATFPSGFSLTSVKATWTP